MESAYKKIIKDTSYLLSSSLLSRFFSGIAGIITARVLGPEDFGLLKIINYVPSLAKFGSFGFSDVAKREIPHIRGSVQNREKEKEIRNVSFSSEILWLLLLSIIIVVISFFYDSKIKYGLWIVSISLFLSGISKVYGICLSVEKRFSILASAGVLKSMLVSAIILSTVYWGEVYSVLFAGLIGGLFTLLYFKQKINLDFSFSISKTEFIRQLKIALPFAGITASYGIYGWTQRIQITILFGIEFLGYYMLVVFFIQSISLLINTFLKASSIELYERLSSSSGSNNTKSLILKPSMILAVILPYIACLAWLGGGSIIDFLLQDYSPSKIMLPFLIPILLFEGISAMPRTAMRSAKLNMQNGVLLLRLISTFFFAVITYIVGYKYDYGLIGIIAARTLATFILFLGSYIMIVKYLFSSTLNMFKTILEMLLPAFIMLIISYLNIKLIGIESLVNTLLCIFLMSLFSSPIFFIYMRKFKLVYLFKGLF